MRQLNARLTVVVAAVAVAAVAGGGVFAYRQGPQTSSADASPLGGQPSPPPSATPTNPAAPKPSATPSKTPSVTPPPPSASKPGVSGPQTVPVSLAKLTVGRTPQLVHSVGREVSGGPVQAFEVPGKSRISSPVQVGGATFVIESREPDLVLVRYQSDGDSQETRNVSAVAGSADASLAAYASQKQKSTGEQLAGGTVYADGGYTRQQLSLPNAWDVHVIAVAAGKVFYASSASQTGRSRLYTWVPGQSSPKLVKSVAEPTAVSADGKLVSSIEAIADGGSCSSVIELSTSKQLWRTCEYMVTDFTPDKSAVIAGPAYGDGYAPQSTWLLDGKDGRVLREWTGLSFRQVRAEDDQHLLMEVDDGPDTKGAIIRCGIPTGECERATPITPGDQFGLGS